MGKNEKLEESCGIENDYTKEQYVEFQKQQKQLILDADAWQRFFSWPHYFCLFWHPIDERLSSLRCF